jgi:HipA-like C-terminal domain
MDLYPVLDITAWEVVESEVLGRNEKVWVREPGAGRDRQGDWLFKPVVVPSSTGHRQGEDWAEKVVSELAGLLGVPCAPVELAVKDGQRGSISRNVVPPGWNRVLGSELLSATVRGYRSGQYDSRGERRAIPGRPGHKLQNIATSLRSCAAPASSGIGSAFEAFAGFLVLDGWVANQDRHDQNWAVLHRVRPSRFELAPSYDHASSLGFNLTDVTRESRRRPGGMMRYAERGRANRFEYDPAAGRAAIPSLVAHAHRALTVAGPPAEERLLGRIAGVREADVEAVVTRIPELSDQTVMFILELLRINRRRLLHDR